MKIRIFIFCILSILYTCCKNQNKTTEEFEKVNEVYSEVNFTDSLIAQNQIDVFYKSVDADSFLIRNVNSFYNERGNQMAWNVDGELTHAADNFYERVMEYMYVARDSQPLFLKLRDTWESPAQL